MKLKYDKTKRRLKRQGRLPSESESDYLSGLHTLVWISCIGI